MKKPLNYFGYAFSDPKSGFNKRFLKSKKGKKEIKKIIESNKRLKKDLKKNGFDRSECWNLDSTIAQFTLPRLKYFRNYTIGFPSDFKNIEQWRETIDKMILSLEYIVEDDYTSDVPFEEVQKGLELFGKYLYHLWI